MTPEQFEQLENSGKYQLGKKTPAEYLYTKFAIQERYARRITIIIYTDGKKVCRYGRQEVNEKEVQIIAYPEVTEQELKELQDESTTLARVRAILDSLTHV